MSKKRQDTSDPTRTLAVPFVEGEALERALAKAALRPVVQAAMTACAITKGDFPESMALSELVNELGEQCANVIANKMERPQATLVAQAHTLDLVFQRLTRRALGNVEAGYTDAGERYLRLAMKAQSQCRATLETLAAIKNPPIVYARQANVTTGPQQVNNGMISPAHAEVSVVDQNKLLEQTDGSRLDFGATSTAGGADPHLATVGELNGAEDAGGEASHLAQRLQGRDEIAPPTVGPTAQTDGRVMNATYPRGIAA